jgi:hypothetical protein
MKRPVGVTVVAAIFIIFGVYGFLTELLVIHDRPDLWEIFLLRGPRTWLVLVPWLILACTVCWPVAGIGLWRLRKWARRLAIILCLLAMAWGPLTFVVFYFAGESFNFEIWLRNPWPLLVRVLFVVIFYGLCFGYMFTSQVKRTFSV